MLGGGIVHHGKRLRFHGTVDLVNALEHETAQGKAGRIASAMLRLDMFILDEMGYLPFSQAGGALLFHLLIKLYERTSTPASWSRPIWTSPRDQCVRRREDDDGCWTASHTTATSSRRVTTATGSRRPRRIRRSASRPGRQSERHRRGPVRNELNRRGASRYGLRSTRLLPRERPTLKRRNEIQLSRANAKKLASTPGSLLGRHGGSLFSSALTQVGH